MISELINSEPSSRTVLAVIRNKPALSRRLINWNSSHTHLKHFMRLLSPHILPKFHWHLCRKYSASSHGSRRGNFKGYEVASHFISSFFDSLTFESLRRCLRPRYCNVIGCLLVSSLFSMNTAGHWFWAESAISHKNHHRPIDLKAGGRFIKSLE